jgi:glutamyl-tRNA(Gln) amidotransferase subunit D
MLPETAYVKLMWAMGQTDDPDEIRKIMLTDIAGEITDRRVL